MVEERALPQAKAGEALVRIRRIGLCGTDYHIYSGRHPYLSYPRVMGHELSGEIVEVREGSSFRRGQLVAINPYLACGQCIACRKGKPNACVHIRVLGVHADGGMAEFLLVPEAALIDAEGLSVDEAAMLEFLAIGAHAVARSAHAPEDRILVVGAGPIGIAAALFARLNGAHITLMDTSASRLNYAQTHLGFDEIAPVDGNMSDAMAGRTNGEMFDVVFDATGSLEAMARSLDYVAHGGKLVFVGVASGDVILSDPEFHKRETTLIASRNALGADFERVKHAILDGLLPVRALHTHSFDVQDMPHRLPELIDGADHVLKAIARFE
ncbi:zinc-binding alcohol dehydrogenase family protein [Sphingobium lactosutens]|nr:zinc-binding alcohol dehydrogenase family protein [Sphingobium lactosutens]